MAWKCRTWGMRVLVALGMWAGAPAVSSADFILQFDSVFNGSSPVGGAPWLTMTFHTIAPGDVRLTIENLLTSNNGQQFVDRVLFNVDPLISALTFNYVSGVKTATTPSYSQNAYGDNTGMAHSGLFDIEFDFSQKAGSRLNGVVGSNVSVYDILGSKSLTEDSFRFLSTQSVNKAGKVDLNDGEYYAAIHVQGIPSGRTTTSGALYGTPHSAQTPLPSSLLLLGTGAVPVACYLRRKRSR